MDFKDIVYEQTAGVAVVAYNRPERMNAWNARMGDEARTAILDAENDPKVRAIILTGSGRAFCAGADMQALNSIAAGNEEIPEHRPASSRASAANPNYQGRFSWMLGLKKPVICAIRSTSFAR